MGTYAKFTRKGHICRAWNRTCTANPSDVGPQTPPEGLIPNSVGSPPNADEPTRPKLLVQRRAIPPLGRDTLFSLSLVSSPSTSSASVGLKKIASRFLFEDHRTLHRRCLPSGRQLYCTGRRNQVVSDSIIERSFFIRYYAELDSLGRSSPLRANKKVPRGALVLNKERSAELFSAP